MSLETFARDLARLSGSGKPLLLAVTHGRGGGVARHVEELAGLLEGRAHHLVLSPGPGGTLDLRWNQPGETLHLGFSVARDYPLLLALLRGLGVDRIHFHHLLGLPAAVMDLPRDLGLPFDFTVHDYFTVCPQIVLTREDNRYCGEPGLEACRACLRSQPAPAGLSIEAWRRRYGALVDGAQRVLAPSQDAARRIQGYFPEARVLVAPHPGAEPGQVRPVPILAAGAPLIVAVLGALTEVKGTELLEACALDAKRRRLPLRFDLIGTSHRHLAQEPRAALRVHGPYLEGALPDLLEALAPQLVWFPCQCPETFSYTLSAVLEGGWPVVAPQLGAFPERVAGRPWSWLLPWELEPGAFNDHLVQIRTEAFVTGRGPLPAPGLAGPPGFRYPEDYVMALATGRQGTPLAPDKVAAWFARVVPEGEALPSLGWLMRLRRLRGLSWLVRLIPRHWQRRLKDRLLGWG